MTSVWLDVRYALRNLRRQPGFTLIAVSILTIGIGLNTALFTLFKEAILQPWSGVADPARVVRVHGLDTDIGSQIGLSHPEYQYLSKHATSFTGLVAWRNETVRLNDSGETNTRITLTTANFFQVLTGAGAMERGRGFLPEEDAPGAPQPVAVLSADLFHRQFGGDAKVIGSIVRLDDVPFRVIGVAPRTLAGSEGSTTRVWIPLRALTLLRPNDARANGIANPDNCCSNIAGRLAPGVTLAQATSELALLSERYRRSVDAKPRPVMVTGTTMMPARERMTVMMVGLGAFVAVLLVLMLACANIGNLLLARAAARVREIGIRLSLGATRRRLVRQLLTESMVLALAAGVAGLFVAMQTVPILRATMDSADGGAVSPDAPPVDWMMLLCTFAVAGLACLAFGLAPALHATRPQLTLALNADGVLSQTGRPLRGFLLGVQVAVSVIFLACAGLIVRGVQQAYAIDLGLSLNDVTFVHFDLPPAAYDSGRKTIFLHQVVERLRTPDGAPIGLASWEPLGGNHGGAPVRHPGQTDEEARDVRTMGVTPGYFDVLRIPIVAGRNFTADDRGSRPVVINQRFAALLWPGQDPIGKRFLSRRKDPIEHEVIGVAKDVRTEDFDAVAPMFYNIFGGALEPALLMRTTDRAALGRVSAIVAALDSRARVRLTPLAANFSDEIAASRRMAVMAGAFGTLALTLASIGMFGVFAYIVQQRTREIGIRMALGAQSRDVVRLVLAGHARPVAIGVLSGVAGAMGVAQLMRHLMFGVSPFDPLAHLGVAVVLAAAGLAASYAPVRRAVRVDPVIALRHD